MKISDFRIDTVECSEDEYLLIPEKGRWLIETYWTRLRSRPGQIRFEIPVYRWEEIMPYLEQSEPASRTSK